MPYRLPDDDVIGACTITFDIPNDEKWATVIIGAISELAIEANWEAGTGVLTPAQASQVALEIRQSVEFEGCIDMQIKVGSYTGDGNSTQAITGVGFLPVVTFVYMRSDGDGNRGIGIRATGDTSAFNVNQADGSITSYRGTIASLDADGFTVSNTGGTDRFSANENGRVYTYVCLGE